MTSILRRIRGLLISPAAIIICIAGAANLRAAGPADQPAATSCKQFMAPKHNASGKAVGQEDCLMQDAGVVDPDRKYHRVEMGISGTLSGWIVKEGRARLNHFTSAPDFLYQQYGNNHTRYHGILKYEASKGTSMTIIYPEAGWNGKLFMLVHGSSGSFRKGTMKAWDQIYNPAKPMGDVTKYEMAMLSKGYAIARGRRNADRFVAGDFSAVLDDGEVWPELNVNLVPELSVDEIRLAGNFLKDRLGHKPSRNYWYGHSAGAYTGLSINYMADEFNKEPDGKRTIDGFIDDDPGGGLFIPMLMKNGQDVLFRTAEEKAKFTKTIVIAHQLYPLTYGEANPGEMDPKEVPKWVSPVALDNKRTAARVFKEKAMGGGFRMYEVKGVSHMGGENLPTGKDHDTEILDLSKLMDGVIDLLDNWVEKDIAPPETRSDAPGLAGSKNALSLPEVACPLGVYFAYPPMRGVAGVAETGFAPFDGTSLEPLDGRIQFVDMNGNGMRDRRETVTEAWRRLGLLKPGESFGRAQYVSCVQDTATKLKQEKFITEKVAAQYVQDAQNKELPAR